MLPRWHFSLFHENYVRGPQRSETRLSYLGPLEGHAGIRSALVYIDSKKYRANQAVMRSSLLTSFRRHVLHLHDMHDYYYESNQ
jgi:hypothetical protein